MLNIKEFVANLPIVFYGMLGIFIVMMIIFIVMKLMISTKTNSN